MARRTSTTILALAAALALALTASAQAATSITANASDSEIVFGDSISISGTTSPPAPAQTATLQVAKYPYDAFEPAGTTTTGADGSFTFDGVEPDRNSRYQVVIGTDKSSPIDVTVDEKLTTEVKNQSLGRLLVRIRSEKPKDLAWGDHKAYWYVADNPSNTFRRVKTNTTKQGSAGVLKLSATFQVPGGSIRFFECFSGPDKQAMGPPEAHGKCHHDKEFTDSNPGTAKQLTASYFFGHASSPYGFPFPSRVDKARSYLNARSGYTAFAVMDSEGRLSGENIHRTFVSASVVKAMLLVAYLRKLDAHHDKLSSEAHDTLYRMIHVSDNAAATSIWRRVGNSRLYDLAHAAHMQDFSICCIWASAQIAAGDQARFFFNINHLLPDQFRSFARSLLAHITSSQSWGIPHVARPRWRVLFKGGWRSTGRGQLVHQVARLERKHATFALAVMTDGDPYMGYGINTIEGVTAKLTGGRTPEASRAMFLGPGGG